MQVGTKIGLAFALLATSSVAAGGLLAPAATGSPDPSGWSEVARMFHREPGAEFSQEQLDEARNLLRAEVANRTVSVSEDAPTIDVKEPGGGGSGGGDGDSCSVSCGQNCGACSASASCDKPACHCDCSCSQSGKCTDCNWCGCTMCGGEDYPDYQCEAGCTGVGGSNEMARQVTIDGENDFTAGDFADWTAQEDGNASAVLDGLVQVASKDIAGRRIAGTNADLAVDTWADVVVAYMDWSAHRG